MKYTIDTDIAKKHGYTEAEYLGILFLLACPSGLNYTIESMRSKELIDMFNQPTFKATQDCQSFLLDADKSVPNNERITALATQMREFFPKGFKSGSAAWRGNVRELSLRLKKFFKCYGNYSDEEILDATKRYVESFNGDYTTMRILKYFIMKSVVNTNEDGCRSVEDVSDLATFLDNEDVTNDGNFVELR